MSEAVLLLNLGTPDAPTIKAVRAYLREFLMDKHVVNIPYPLRALLVHGFIVPSRAPQTLKNYEKIWQEDSPLRIHTENQVKALQALMPEVKVVYAMRYGTPSIPTVLRELLREGIQKLTIIPLFPQYAVASTGSALALVHEILSKASYQPLLKIISSFHDHPLYIQALAAVYCEHLQEIPEHVVFSYHGLPEHHIEQQYCNTGCSLYQDCDATQINFRCYRAQCYRTSQLLADALNLTRDQYSVAFQSRLGHVPWIKPYTDTLLTELQLKKVDNIAIISPSFVADCLETLEELGIQLAQKWEARSLHAPQLIPCVNDHPLFMDCLKALCIEEM